VASFCEKANKLSDSIEEDKILDHLSGHYVHSKEGLYSMGQI
jgi:hypothetical protein